MFQLSTSQAESNCSAQAMNSRWSRRFYPVTLTMLSFSFMYLYLSSDSSSPPIELPAGTVESSEYFLSNSRASTSFRPKFFLLRGSYNVEGENETPPVSQLLDMDNFYFLKNASHVCQSSNSVKILAFVHTSTSNFKKRQIIRKTWASKSTQTDLHLRTVFLVGLTTNQTVQNRLDEESASYNDIVQGNFIDSYRNLTYKHLMGYKWVLMFCRNANLVVKIDDDAFVDIYRVAYLVRNHGWQSSSGQYEKMTADESVASVYHDNHVNKDHDSSNEETQSGLKNLISCSMFPEGTKVKRYGKWKLSTHDYPFETFPAYCSGIAYFLTPDVIQDLYRASFNVKPFLWIDDLFITGILVAHFPSIKHRPLNFKFTYSSNSLRNWLKTNQLHFSPYMIGDIGDVSDWESLMVKLWAKTVKVWKG